ncbi:MAG: hypothetical protein ACRD0P_01330 [Stackebrandtia sp.]
MMDAHERERPRPGAINITVKSPDRSVTARYSVHDGVKLLIDANSMVRHDEQTLAGQITAAILGIQTGFSRAFEAMNPASGGREDVVDNPSRRETPTHVIPVSVTSPSGCVHACLTAAGEPRFGIRPGTLRRRGISPSALADEVTSAYRALQNEYVSEVKRSQHVRDETTGMTPR